MTLTIVQVAFPFATVSADAVGGAEQIVAQLDAGLSRRGHRSVLVAAAGSRGAGRLHATPVPDGAIDDAMRRDVHAVHAATLAAAVREGCDLVHMHGLDFCRYLPPAGVPTLATLHLPADCYSFDALHPTRPGLWLNPVSRSQHRACPPSPALLPPVENGVPVDALPARLTRRTYALALGRVCPEKNLHVALDAGTRAEVPVLLCGAVFPYADHQRYFREQIAPRLAPGRHRFLGPVGFARKRRLLNGARCLLSASLAAETSSLVAMEAIACGTPVIAFPSGALPDIVQQGVTGFLVDDVAAMARAIHAAPSLDAETCRAVARRRFSAEAMVDRYVALYERLLQTTASHAA